MERCSLEFTFRKFAKYSLFEVIPFLRRKVTCYTRSNPKMFDNKCNISYHIQKR